MAVDLAPVDGIHLIGKELGDILVGGPVLRHAKLVAVFLLEAPPEAGLLEPVIAEPVEVRELLVGELVQPTAGAGAELPSDKVLDVEGRQRHVAALPLHVFTQDLDVAVAKMRADQIGIVNVGVVEIGLVLHLLFDILHDLPLGHDLVSQVNAGNLGECLREGIRLVLMGRDLLGRDLNIHANEIVTLGRVDEPLKLIHLLLAAQR